MLSKLTVQKVAEIVDGCIEGNKEVILNNLNRIENASEGDITFFYNDKYLKYLDNCRASCIILSKNIEKVPNTNQCFIKVNDPYKDFVKLLKYIEKNYSKHPKGTHHSVVIGENCLIDNDVFLGANVVIGDNCIIKSGCKIYPNVTIYGNVNIDSNTTIHSNVAIYQDVIIGKNSIIHSGAVIGSDGFGFIESNEHIYDKVPQLGNVIIKDNVEIGANSTIDRALVGSTIINQGTKIDNLVHIAHNCEIGQNNGIAAHTGFSGSVKTGDNCKFGGQTGIAGHLEITDNVMLLAQSGVSKSIKKPGVYFGSPSKEVERAFKIEAVIRQLPELYEEINKLINQ